MTGREIGEWGEWTPPALAGLCSYSLTLDEAGACGKPAVEHAWPGAAPDTREEWTAFSCADHLVLREKLWDWHPVASGACSIPGARWRAGEIQGEGRCAHELDDDAAAIIREDNLARIRRTVMGKIRDGLRRGAL